MKEERSKNRIPMTFPRFPVMYYNVLGSKSICKCNKHTHPGQQLNTVAAIAKLPFVLVQSTVLLSLVFFLRFFYGQRTWYNRKSLTCCHWFYNWIKYNIFFVFFLYIYFFILKYSNTVKWIANICIIRNVLWK